VTKSDAPISIKLSQLPAMTGLSRSRIYELVKCGELPAFRPGGQGEYLVKLSDLDSAIERWKEVQK
jgi:excisionase family DNA binding protein